MHQLLSPKFTKKRLFNATYCNSILLKDNINCCSLFVVRQLDILKLTIYYLLFFFIGNDRKASVLFCEVESAFCGTCSLSGTITGS